MRFVASADQSTDSAKDSVFGDHLPNTRDLEENPCINTFIDPRNSTIDITSIPINKDDYMRELEAPMDLENLHMMPAISQSLDKRDKHEQPQPHLQLQPQSQLQSQSVLQPQQPQQQQQSNLGCCCIDQILAANETIQHQLVWQCGSSHHGSTISIDDTLQCQKNILNCTEGLLECLQCSSRSDYITLTVSVCREIMTSVVNLIDTTINPVLAECPPSPPSSVGVKRSRNGKEYRRNRSRSSSHSSNSNINRAATEASNINTTTMVTTAGRWRLDDQEEMQIVWNLISVRVTRLQRLIQQLEQVAIANQLGCIRVVQATRRSFESGIANINSKREGAGKHQ